MSRLEDRVKPLIGPTIRAPIAPLVLTVDDQGVVAKWSVKTALVLQAALLRGAQKANYVPPDHLNWFAERKDNRDDYDPPPATQVWAFLRRPITPTGSTSLAFATTFSAAAIRHESGSKVPSPVQPNQPEAYITTFAIGYLGFQVVGQNRPIEGQASLVVNAEMASILSRVLIPIWPAVKPRNRWPPGLIIGPTDLELLSRWGLDSSESQPLG